MVRPWRPAASIVGVLAWTLVLPAVPAAAFNLVTPKEGAQLTSGERIPVKVDLGRDTGVVEVRYYWYGDLDETLVEKEEATSVGSIVAKASLTAAADSDPPYGGQVQVPPEAIGPMRLLAVGEISRGRLGGRSVFDEIIVHVEPKAELTAIEFETEKPLRLGRSGQSADYGHVDVLGKIFELPVVGVFSDGIVRTIRSPATGTAYRSSDPNVITIHPQGLLQIVGNGKTTVTATNRDKSADLEIIVEVNDEPNEPPIADAGPNRTVKAGARVELNGLKSRDPEGEALFYSWSQVRGNKVALLDPNMPKASFVAPFVSEKRLYRFRLRVSDRKGAESLPAYVDVTVEP
ncbi:PKD domain-containing protein [Candidatus Nitrospira bockiana]